MDTFNDAILEKAVSYIGQEEIGNNMGWKDKAFEASMKAIGWMYGWAWCMSSVRLVYLETSREFYGINSLEYIDLKSMLSHSVIRTYRNIKESSRWIIQLDPVPGGIILWDYGKGKGHCGIFSTHIGKLSIVLEGNTNKKGQREGKYFMPKECDILARGERYLGCATYKGVDR